jgi:D-alanine-D-alanine ligase
MARNIILLFGGESNERLVSVASAQNMASALDKVTLWFWHVSGGIFELSYDELMQHKEPFTKQLVPQGSALFPTISEAIRSPLSQNSTFLLGLHGGAGENGTLQKMLEEAGHPFTGSGSKVSAIAFDKIKTKEAVPKDLVRILPHMFVSFASNGHGLERIKEAMTKWGAVILKPVAGGSSLGCHKITREEHFTNAMAELESHPTEMYMLEKLVFGRDLTVSVIEIDNKNLTVLPVTEIITLRDDVDYEAKYLDPKTEEITPAAITEQERETAQQMALSAHRSLGLKGYSRSDFMLTNDGVYFLEINTLPGLTRASLLPRQLLTVDQSMKDFLEHQIALANK